MNKLKCSFCGKEKDISLTTKSWVCSYCSRKNYVTIVINTPFREIRQ